VRQTTLFLVVALSTGFLLLPGYQDVISVSNFRMSNRPNGPSVIQFPSVASDVYAVFNYTPLPATRKFESEFSMLLEAPFFDLSRTYTGAGTESIQITGHLPDGTYLTVVYVYLHGNYSPAASVEWAIGLDAPATLTPSSTPGVTQTATPTLTSTPTSTPTVTATRTLTPGPTPTITASSRPGEAYLPFDTAHSGPNPNSHPHTPDLRRWIRGRPLRSLLAARG